MHLMIETNFHIIQSEKFCSKEVWLFHSVKLFSHHNYHHRLLSLLSFPFFISFPSFPTLPSDLRCHSLPVIVALLLRFFFDFFFNLLFFLSFFPSSNCLLFKNRGDFFLLSICFSVIKIWFHQIFSSFTFLFFKLIHELYLFIHY